jgi:hypothetical protein
MSKSREWGDAARYDFRCIRWHPRLFGRFRVAASLIEIDGEGWVRRQVDLAAEGRPLAVMGADRPPSFDWGLTDCHRGQGFSPGTRAYEEYWSSRDSSPVTAAEFETVYGRAEAGRPNSFREFRVVRLVWPPIRSVVLTAVMVCVLFAMPVLLLVFLGRTAATSLGRAVARWIVG